MLASSFSSARRVSTTGSFDECTDGSGREVLEFAQLPPSSTATSVNRAPPPLVSGARQRAMREVALAR